MLPTFGPRDQPLDPAQVGATAAWAEELGFDALWAGDHIVHPWQFLESLISLTFAAARTQTCEIGTCMLLLPMRQLAIVAAQISTLAILSNGRFNLGVGIGGEWPLEWQAAGVPTTERGARLNEALPLLRRLLAGEVVNHQGRFNTISDFSLAPPPPPVPLYLAGQAPPALERVGRLGDGWIGFFLTPNGFKRDSAAIDKARGRAGRSDAPFTRGMMLHFHLESSEQTALERAVALNFGFPRQLELAGTTEQLRRFALIGTPETVRSRMEAYIEAGCTIFALSPMEKQNNAYQEQVRILAAEVLPKISDHKQGGSTPLGPRR